MSLFNRFAKETPGADPSLPLTRFASSPRPDLDETLRDSQLRLVELEKQALLLSPLSRMDRAQLRYEIDLLRYRIAEYESEIAVLPPAPPKPVSAIQLPAPHLPASCPPGLNLPAINPYTGENGLPVAPPLFTGRATLLSEIYELWQHARPLPPLVLYGHKLMGKSSILRNLKMGTNRHDVVVLLDLLHKTLVDSTAEFLYKVAQEIEIQARAAGLKTGNVVFPENFDTTTHALIAMDDLLELLDRQMRHRRLILAIDEFELLEDCIDQDRVEAVVLEYLKAVSDNYNWIGLIFAGHHTMDEMRWNYRSLFHRSAKYLKVGFLRPEETYRLVTQPDNFGFILEYEPELVEAIYGLTYGQPYLVQVLCSELIYNWNEHWQNRKGQLTPLLKLSDLEATLDNRFYRHAHPYFEGVWQQAEPLEQKLMLVIADWQEKNRASGKIISILRDEAFELSGLEREDFEFTLASLARHDLVWEYKGYLSFATELMRRWLVRQHPKKV